MPCALVGGLVGVLVGGLVGGLAGQKMDHRRLVTPNQGILRSARNSVFFGLGAGLFFGLLGGLLGGVSAGLFFGLVGGGDAFIQHFVLRWFLWSAGSLPWKYPRFLNYAVERILLNKVGGGYIFLHRLLLDYFASLPPTVPTSMEKHATYHQN